MSKIPKHKFPFILILISTLVTLLVGEIFLRIYFGKSPLQFSALAKAFSQEVYFFHLKPGDPLSPKESQFHPYLGWTPGERNGSDSLGTYNNDGWRSKHPFEETKTRTRIALLGDSFTAGHGLKDDETVDFFLSQMLGEKYEVMNFAGSGYGVDQMVIVGTEILPKYQPDYIFLSFIGDDLLRSCVQTAGGVNLKPVFKDLGSSVKLMAPIPPPDVNAAHHQKPLIKLKDKIIGQLITIRLVSLVAQPFFQFAYERCGTHLNLKLFDKLVQVYGDKAKTTFVHLFRDFPLQFEKGIRAKNYNYLDLANPVELEKLEKRLGVKAGVVDGYHPDKYGTLVHARAYADIVQNFERDRVN